MHNFSSPGKIPPPMDCTVQTFSDGAQRPAHHARYRRHYDGYLVGNITFDGSIGSAGLEAKPFFDGRIVPGFGGASKQTVDLGPINDAIVKAISALTELHDKLAAAPS